MGYRSKETIRIIPIHGLQEVSLGQDIGRLILEACSKNELVIEDHDVFVIAHKIVSKSEGRVVDLASVTPSTLARKLSSYLTKDPKLVETILSGSKRLVKVSPGFAIAETHHGFICANSGVNLSNVGLNKLVLLPLNPDKSAERIRTKISEGARAEIAVIVSDSFGRAWRKGQVNVAIGLSGLDPFVDYRGATDQYGYNLKASVICIADEIASAAELCMNKLDRVPVAIIRGYPYARRQISAKQLVRKPSRDLFR